MAGDGHRDRAAIDLDAVLPVTLTLTAGRLTLIRRRVSSLDLAA
jgi:hypothetical protein